MDNVVRNPKQLSKQSIQSIFVCRSINTSLLGVFVPPSSITHLVFGVWVFTAEIQRASNGVPRLRKVGTRHARTALDSSLDPMTPVFFCFLGREGEREEMNRSISWYTNSSPASFPTNFPGCRWCDSAHFAFHPLIATIESTITGQALIRLESRSILQEETRKRK